MKKIHFLLAVLVISLTSCLKDKPNTNFSGLTPIIELPYSGKSYFSQDAITDAGPTITKQFVVNIASVNVPTTATSVTIGVDNSLIAPYNTANPAITYNPMPTGSYTFPDMVVNIPAGQRQATLTVTIDKSKLDPSQSYLLPITIKSAPGLTISGNFGVHYYHFIGNDFAGTYTYEYRRYQNGTGPGAGATPSLGEGSAPDITNPAGSTTIISPVTATEFQMVTNYNGQGVMYDVTFTRTVSSSGTVSYTNWSVSFPDAEIAKWAAAGITNKVLPKFTVPPPATSSDRKKFELNYVSGSTSGRYIDDTYFK